MCRSATSREQQRKWIIDGDPKEDFDGVTAFFKRLERKKYKLHVRVFLSRYRGYATCPDCNGTRLRRKRGLCASRESRLPKFAR